MCVLTVAAVQFSLFT